MNNRERLERTLAGEQADRVPVALWRHFPGDDQRAADFARSTVEWQTMFDWDFLKVTPASSYSVADYGVQDQWEGSMEGTRVYTKRAVVRSLDWTDLRTLDPTRGVIARTLDALRMICEALGETVPILMTIFSPLAQAKNIAGNEVLLRHLRMQPDRVRSGLNVITESTLRLIDALRRFPVAGIFYAIQHASYRVLSEDEYLSFGLPYDRKILDALPDRWWFNLAHLHGHDPMFKFASQLPVQAVNWHDRGTEPTLLQAKLQFNGVLCGGVSASEHIHLGTPAAVRDAARDAVIQMNNKRLILSADCVIPITSPLSNIRALREVV
jgi:uroporphyrinogen decarboxylase